jgi:hypothetical protein
MARGRMHPQNLQERLMPCAQFEALERHQQARRDRGVDSNELTVKDDNDNDAEDRSCIHKKISRLEQKSKKVPRVFLKIWCLGT